MKIKGWDLSFFNSGEWQVADEHLKDIEKVYNRVGRQGYNPKRVDLFRSLRLSPLESVRVAIIGQDPYPESRFATGVAFSIPADVPSEEWPPTLNTILREYATDLRLPIPSTGDLTGWCSNGVLLWNAIPSTLVGKSMAHDWPEWRLLTSEIIRKLSERGVTFALLGQVARSHIGDINPLNNSVVVTSHPSPRGSLSSRNPFTGSRIFTTLNDKLVNNGQEPIDWKLP